MHRHTDLIEHKHQALPLTFSPPHLLLHKPAPASLRVAGVQDHHNDISLVNDLV